MKVKDPATGYFRPVPLEEVMLAVTLLEACPTLRVEEVADIFGVHPNTVYNWRFQLRRGHLRGGKIAHLRLRTRRRHAA